ncbi:unnamed protein product [Clonostachys rhizophaga]|uniref:Uncharacterized protein n=1 Tax=Clonostachys rhizophaga TaxID=160324 RepID=A0A9N9V769_9HYPO|nr:unnamed protein product [Clonostachys rhizophaga]
MAGWERGEKGKTGKKISAAEFLRTKISNGQVKRVVGVSQATAQASGRASTRRSCVAVVVPVVGELWADALHGASTYLPTGSIKHILQGL